MKIVIDLHKITIWWREFVCMHLGCVPERLSHRVNKCRRCLRYQHLTSKKRNRRFHVIP